MKDYKVTTVKEVGEPDQYGNKAFSVFFEGEAKPVFMKTKNGNEPTPAKLEYGVIEDAPKANGQGTYRKFTRKQKEEATQEASAQGASSTPYQNTTKDELILKQVALKCAVQVEKDAQKVLEIAQDFNTWLQGTSVEEVPPPTDEDNQTDPDEINIDDIEF